CPSIIRPQSLAPQARLIADITRPPKNPIVVMVSAISAACHVSNGVIQESAAPSMVALVTPPTSPSQVFEGDTAGATLCRPQSLPQTYCSTSLDCATSNKNTISNRSRPSYPGMSSVSSAGTCEIQYTQITRPHCIFARCLRRPGVAPAAVMTIGRI